MNIIDIIEKKKRKIELSSEELEFFSKGTIEGSIKDYQISAFLMAIYFNGLTNNELYTLTDLIANSGEKITLNKKDKKIIDKHSTGGVGDKTSLIALPLASSLGLTISKLSGRGLGHTGGTIDKLESIPGFRTDYSLKELEEISEKNGISLGQGRKNIAYLDKILYSIRDVTGTVDSIPLIASSIMGKKLAIDSDGIVLDVKCGSGAFMKTFDRAKNLAETMVKIGKNHGRNTVAIISNMDQPLGSYIGNFLEVIEAYKIFCNEGDKDLRDLSISLSSYMIKLAGNNLESFEEIYKRCEDNLENGKALEKFKSFIVEQGGDFSYIESYEEYMKDEKFLDIIIEEDTYISSIDTEEIGKTALLLGAGRYSVTDVIDYKAGIIMYKKIGDKLDKNDRIARLYSSSDEKLLEAKDRFLNAIKFGNGINKKDIIMDIIE